MYHWIILHIIPTCGGVFGAPSFIVDDVLYFGNDRMDFVAEALAGNA